jgi:hypothetical protein
MNVIQKREYNVNGEELNILNLKTSSEINNYTDRLRRDEVSSRRTCHFCLNSTDEDETKYRPEDIWSYTEDRGHDGKLSIHLCPKCSLKLSEDVYFKKMKSEIPHSHVSDVPNIFI